MRISLAQTLLYAALSVTLPLWFLLALMVEIGNAPLRALLKFGFWTSLSILLALKMHYPIITGSLGFAYLLGYGYVLSNRFRISLRKSVRLFVRQAQFRQTEASFQLD